MYQQYIQRCEALGEDAGRGTSGTDCQSHPSHGEGMMEPVTLAASVVALLSPYLVKGSEAVCEEVWRGGFRRG